MIAKAVILFCDNEHGLGEVSFPDLSKMDVWEIEQHFISGKSVRDVRREAKTAGWGRVNGGDYCPLCLESM